MIPTSLVFWTSFSITNTQTPSMHFLKWTLALSVSQWSSVLAQQSCYWPNGSNITQGYWMNCHSSQDSVCCYYRDVCLSNGLCYGSSIGMVRTCAPFQLQDCRSGRVSCRMNADSQTKVYRGGCTVQDWSNTTACPNHWCNNGEGSFHGRIGTFL